jgi:hypothetical protein
MFAASVMVKPKLLHLQSLRLRAVGITLTQVDTMLACSFKHGTRFSGVCRQGFFAKNVLSGLDGADRPFGMQAVG